MTAIGKFYYGKWVRSKAGHYGGKVEWTNARLIYLSYSEPSVENSCASVCQLQDEAFLHLALLKHWSGQVQVAYDAEDLKFILLLGLSMRSLGFWDWTLSAQCLNVKLSMFWAEHYKSHHSSLFSVWESKPALSLKFLVDQLYSPAYYCNLKKCFNFCAVACWLLVVTTGLDVAWRNYQKITWAIFPRENPEFYYKVGNRGGKFKTRGLRQCLLWYLPWFSTVQTTVLSNV